MAELLETSSYFGLTLTLAIFWISHIGCRKLKISILNPILISSAIIIIILLALTSAMILMKPALILFPNF